MTLDATYDEVSGCVILSGDTGDAGPLTITRTSDGGCATHADESPVVIRTVDGVFSFTDCSAGPGRTFVYTMGAEESDAVVTDLPIEFKACDPLWIKNKRDPSANVLVQMSGPIRPAQQAGRAGVFEVIGRKMPVAVTDVLGSRTWSVTIVTGTMMDARRLRNALCPGDTVLLQTLCGHPVLCEMDWFTIASVTQSVGVTDWPNVSCCCCEDCPHQEYSEWELTLREVAAPRHDEGSLATWDCLCDSGLTWNDLCATYTWDEVCAVDGPARCPADDGCGCT